MDRNPKTREKMSEAAASGSLKTEELDAALHMFGFQMVEVSAKRVAGQLPITSKCCQPYKVLHGGVSAMIAESLASIGAHLASGRQRVAGVHLSISHLKSAKLGDFVVAEAAPLNVGRSIQVWDVRLWKCDPVDRDVKTLVSSARVTLLCNLPVPESLKAAADFMKPYAKL